MCMVTRLKTGSRRSYAGAASLLNRARSHGGNLMPREALGNVLVREKFWLWLDIRGYPIDDPA